MRMLTVTIALGVAFSLTSAAVPTAEPMAPVADQETEPLTLVSWATSDQMTMIDWALERYAAAGLELPPLEVLFHDDSEPCGGNMAIAVTGAVTRIKVCTDPDAPDIVIERTLLHELAHIWAASALDDATRQAFLALRGLDSWSNADQWSERGTEQAAEIVMWALMDREIMMLTLEHHEPQDLAAGYRVLTGQEPPNRS